MDDLRANPNRSYRLYLDDIRPMPEGFHKYVNTAQEAIEQLKTGNVTHISLDHDLGDDENNGTGADVARFIEEEAFFERLPPLTWEIHSANPVGRKNMTAALENADKYWKFSQTERKQ